MALIPSEGDALNDHQSTPNWPLVLKGATTSQHFLLLAHHPFGSKSHPNHSKTQGRTRAFQFFPNVDFQMARTMTTFIFKGTAFFGQCSSIIDVDVEALVKMKSSSMPRAQALSLN